MNKRLLKSLDPSSVEVDYCVLPPLFLRSQKDEIALLSQVIIVFCATGPIIPIAFSKNNRTLHGDEQLPNLIMRLYQATCNEFVNVNNFKALLEKVRC